MAKKGKRSSEKKPSEGEHSLTTEHSLKNKAMALAMMGLSSFFGAVGTEAAERMIRPAETSVVYVVSPVQPASQSSVQDVPGGEPPTHGFSVTIVDKNKKEMTFSVAAPTQQYIRPVPKAADPAQMPEGDYIIVKSQVHPSAPEHVFHVDKEHMLGYLSENPDVRPELRENLNQVKEIRVSPVISP